MPSKYIPGIIVLLFLSALTGCLKQDDDTKTGPRAQIAIINASLDSEPLFLLVDGAKVNEEGVAFGEVSGTVSNAYIPLRPGVRNTSWMMGTGPALEEKLFPWEPGAYYTMIQFDTAVNNQAPTILFKDVLNVNDSVGRARFFNTVAGNDSLSLVAVRTRDTVRIASRQPFLANVSSVTTNFASTLRAGGWRFDLLNKDSVVIYTNEILIEENTVYSFIATGETGGVGEKAPSLLQVVHRK